MVDCRANEVTSVVAAALPAAASRSDAGVVLAALFAVGSAFAKLRRGKRTAF